MAPQLPADAHDTEVGVTLGFDWASPGRLASTPGAHDAANASDDCRAKPNSTPHARAVNRANRPRCIFEVPPICGATSPVETSLQPIDCLRHPPFSAAPDRGARPRARPRLLPLRRVGDR